MRHENLFIACVAIALTTQAAICGAQPSLRPDNVFAQTDSIEVYCFPDRVIYGEAPSKVMVFVKVHGDVELLAKNPPAMLDIKNGKELVVRAPIAPKRLSAGLEYHFVFARGYLANSTFSFMGAERHYKIDLMHWCRCEEIIASRFHFISNEVAQGDTARVLIDIEAHVDTKLMFGSSCQVEYRVRDNSGSTIATGPDRICTDSPTGIDLELGQSKQMEMPVFTSWLLDGKANELEYLNPGVYNVECWVRGYADFGLRDEIELTVRRK